MLGRRHQGGRVGAVVLAGVLAITAAACTKSSHKSSSTSDSSSVSTGATPATAAGTKATGTPVKIGLTNAESGATRDPGAQGGRDLAVEADQRPRERAQRPPDRPRRLLDRRHARIVGGVREQVGRRSTWSRSSTGRSSAATPRSRSSRTRESPPSGTSTIGTSQSLNQDAFFWSPAATSFPAIEVDLAAAVGVKNLTLLVPDVPQVPIVSGIAEKQAQLHGIEVQPGEVRPGRAGLRRRHRRRAGERIGWDRNHRHR